MISSSSNAGAWLGLLTLFFFVLLYFLVGFKCLFSKIFIGRVLGIVLLLLPVFLLGTCGYINLKHDSEARQLLAEVRKLPLPAGARLVFEQSEVGNYLSSTGDATDVVGYRIFVTELSLERVSDFYEPFKKKVDTCEIGVLKLDAPPRGPYLDMNEILKHIPENDRSHAFLLYAVNRCEEDGLWDVRGW